MTKLPVSVAETQQILYKCLRIAVDLGMLKESHIENGTIRVRSSSNRSYGGLRYKNGKPSVYVSLNIGRSIGNPDNSWLKNAYRIFVNDAKRNTAKVRAFRRSLKALESGLYTFTEYPSFAEDPEIGSVFSDDPKVCMATLVAHEVAHAVACLSPLNQYRGRNHDNGWKRAYREIRKHLLAEYQSPQEMQEIKAVASSGGQSEKQTSKKKRNKGGVMHKMMQFVEEHGYQMTRQQLLYYAEQVGWSRNTMSIVHNKWKNGQTV